MSNIEQVNFSINFLRSTDDTLNLKSSVSIPTPESIEHNGIAVFDSHQAERLVQDDDYLMEVSGAVVRWIKDYNARFSLTPDDEISANIKHLLLSDDLERNILRHEARHVMAVPETQRKNARFAISAMGSITPDADEFNPESWKLYISQVAGIAYGYDFASLSDEEMFLIASAPRYLSSYDIRNCQIYINNMIRKLNKKAFDC